MGYSGSMSFSDISSLGDICGNAYKWTRASLYLWPDAAGDERRRHAGKQSGLLLKYSVYQTDDIVAVYLHGCTEHSSICAVFSGWRKRVTSHEAGCSGHLYGEELGRPYTDKY